MKIVIKGTKGKELFFSIFEKTKSYIKTKEILKSQYNIDIYIKVD